MGNMYEQESPAEEMKKKFHEKKCDVPLELPRPVSDQTKCCLGPPVTGIRRV